MTCPDCTQAAQRWNWGGYHTSCPDCQIRAIAQAPRHIRELRYDQILRKEGQQAVEIVKASVRVEYARIKGLRGTT